MFRQQILDIGRCEKSIRKKCNPFQKELPYDRAITIDIAENYWLEKKTTTKKQCASRKELQIIGKREKVIFPFDSKCLKVGPPKKLGQRGPSSYIT